MTAIYIHFKPGGRTKLERWLLEIRVISAFIQPPEFIFLRKPCCCTVTSKLLPWLHVWKAIIYLARAKFSYGTHMDRNSKTLNQRTFHLMENLEKDLLRSRTQRRE
nr:uncharacterized protein LOC113459185 [Zonotrichia albicollis]